MIIRKLVRTTILNKIIVNYPWIGKIAKHIFGVCLSSYVVSYKLSFFFPLVLGIILFFFNNLIFIMCMQCFFLLMNLIVRQLSTEKRLNKFSYILREVFRYQNSDPRCKLAILHFSLLLFLYVFNWVFVGIRLLELIRGVG